MRRGVKAYNAANGIKQTFGPDGGGYHETLTVAWMHALMGAYGPLRARRSSSRSTRIS